MTYSIAELASLVGGEACGQTDLTVSGLAEPASATPKQLALAMSPKFAECLVDGKAQAAILWADADWQGLGLKAAILVGRTRYALSGLTARFAPDPFIAEPGVHPSAVIDPTATLAPGAAVGPFVIIGPGATIGAHARIGAHTTIGRGAVIGADALLHPGVRIADDVRIGQRFRGHSNSVIGSDGFSYVTPEPDAVEQVKKTFGNEIGAHQSEYSRIASLGSVVIGDDVEVGANCSVDKGTVANTSIGDGTKLDNLVHVGHNVQVGRTCLLCAQVGIAGSSTIGDRVVLAGQVGVADHTRVGNDVIAGGASKIHNNIPDGRVVMGSPAIRMDENIAAYKAIRRLPRLVAKVAGLEKTVSKLNQKD